MSIGFDISCSFCCFEAARGGVASLLTAVFSSYLRKQGLSLYYFITAGVLVSLAIKYAGRISLEKKLEFPVQHNTQRQSLIFLKKTAVGVCV